MKIPLTYEEAKQRHPREVAASVRALRASCSTQKATAPSKLNWHYRVVVHVDPDSLKTLRPRVKRTLEEQIQDQLARAAVSLIAGVGRWVHAQNLDTLPPEWERYVRGEFKRIQEERDAFEALPVRERELRAEEASVAAQCRDKGFLKHK